MRRIFVFLMAVIAVSGAARGRTGFVGNPAPPLPMLETIAGTPVTRFERGQAYVVAFVATWSEGGRAALPFLNRFQREYPAVHFVGLFGYERNRAAVTDFYQANAASMGFTIAYDRKRDGDRNWMKPAGRDILPCIFLVGRDGRIAWVGLMQEMAQPLDALARSAAPTAGRNGAAGKLRFLSPPPANLPISGEVTLKLSDDPTPRTPSIRTVVKVDGADAATPEKLPADFVWEASKLAPGRHLLTLARRDTATGREFLTDTVSLTVGGPNDARTPHALPENVRKFVIEVIAATNKERVKAGLKPLTTTPSLMASAQRHADDMAENEYFAHDDRSGGGPLERAKASGYPPDAPLAENLASGYPTAQKAVAGWMSSKQGHKENLLNPQWTTTGVGYAALPGRKKAVWVQVFGVR